MPLQQCFTNIIRHNLLPDYSILITNTIQKLQTIMDHIQHVANQSCVHRQHTFYPAISAGFGRGYSLADT